MDTEWIGQVSETSAPSPVLGVAGVLVRQKEARGVSKEAAGFGEEVYTVLTPDSRGWGEKAAFLLFVQKYVDSHSGEVFKGVYTALMGGARLHEVYSDGCQALVSSARKRQACVEPV